MEIKTSHKGENQKNEALQKAELLLQRIDWSIEDVGKKRVKNQRKATIVKFFLLALSGGATILLGLNFPGQESLLKNVAFTFSALVTLLTAFEPFFNFRALWIEHEQAKARFYRLRNELRYYLEGRQEDDISIDDITSIKESYQNTWDELSNAWIRERRLGSKRFKNSTENEFFYGTSNQIQNS